MAGVNSGGVPQGGAGIYQQPVTARTPETIQERKERIAQEELKEQLADPQRFQPGQPGQTQGPTRTVLKKVRVRRNNGESSDTNSTNGTNGSGQTGRSGRAGGPQGTQGSYHMLQRSSMGQSDLVRASVLYQNNQAQQQQQNNPTNLGVRNRMLNGLQSYIQNDYQMMKLNPDDKAFTYRTAEARQLGATIGQMVASTSRQASGTNKTNEETPSPRLSPEAFGRQKGLLRRLSAMSEPNPRMPDNLPADYRPFESVA